VEVLLKFLVMSSVLGQLVSLDTSEQQETHKYR